MAKNTSRPTLYEIYKDVCFDLGVPASVATASHRLSTSDFLNKMNSAKRMLSSYTQDIYRLAILVPERNWIRCVARPYEDDGGMIRVDLQGQTRELLKTGDCKCWQYENICSGDGTDPNPVGRGDIVNTVGPDTFPLFAFPSECGIGEDDFPPALYHGDREIGEPLTSGIFDIRTIGYGGNDPTSDDFPNAANPNSYLRDIFMVYAMRRLTYTTGNDGAIPYSPDEYLNSTWTDILGLAAGGGIAGVLAPPNNTFVVDGYTYTVSMVDAVYNVTTDDPFTFQIRATVDGTNHDFRYVIYPSYTPWQTVSTPATCNRWGNLFNDEASHSARPRYIAFNQWFVNFPDDLEEIRRFWELPMDIWRQFLDSEDPTADPTVEEIVTSTLYTLNRTSGAVQLFPINESRFSWQKWMEAEGWLSDENRDTGYYLKTGEKAAIVPRSRNPRDALYALLYVALDDKYNINMDYSDFQTTYVNLHGVQQEFFVDFILWRIYKAAQGADSDAARDAKESWMSELVMAKEKRAHRHQQEGDAPLIARELPMGAMNDKPFFDPIGDPDDWIPDVAKDRTSYL